jgi:HNH endonuclease
MPEDCDVRPFQLDHIRSQKHAGSSDLENLAWSCLPCNSFKGPNVAGYEPDSDRLFPLFNPRQDHWSEHFAWKGSVLIGLTPIGRTTIVVLKINQPDRVEHRRLLLAGGFLNGG